MRAISQTGGLVFNSNREMAHMENALPWSPLRMQETLKWTTWTWNLKKKPHELSALLVLKKKGS